ncbi:LppU family putative lipoprotein [Rhodococcus triatomae]
MWAGLRRRIGLGAMVVGALLAVGCSSTVDGTATAAGGTTTTTATTAANQVGTDGGGDVDIDVEIGECVRLGGTMDAATISEASCGSADSNYRVIAKAEKNAQCPSDADQVYYEESALGRELGALCLDIDWVIGGCMSVPDGGDDEPQRVDCADTHVPGVERAVDLIEGATDVEQCTEGGFVYSEREFVVCTEQVRPL